MAIFLLIRDNTTPDSIPTRLIQRLSFVGLPLVRQVRASGWGLWLFGAFNGQAPFWVETKEGDLATATGWFAFDGLTGDEALRRLLEAFDGHALDWGRCRGHFHLVLRKGGRWYLLRDGLDAGKVYYNTEESWFSNSFHAVFAGIRHPEPERQGCYEYAFNGTPFGEKTFVKQIRMVPAGTMTVLEDHGVIHTAMAEAMPWYTEPGRVDCEAVAGLYLDRLRALFRIYIQLFGDRLRTAISGGYDSRLILALLLEAGAKPELFIYGNQQGDPEVDVAREVAAAAGLPLEIIDKSKKPLLTQEQCREHVERNLIVFDGWKPSGLFDSGVDVADRLERSRDRVLMSGSVGEIFRNFYYLPNRPLSLQEVVWCFYSRYHPGFVTKAFSSQAYADAMTEAMRSAVLAPSGDRRVQRGWTERTYPLFRGRFWTARDLNINLRFAPVIYPFLEADIVRDTWHIPLSCKHNGMLEARMIALAAPALAACRSIYGHAFTTKPTWRYRLAMGATLLRPVALRGYNYRLHYRNPRPLPFYLTSEWLGRVVDLSFPCMRELFNIEGIHDPDVYNRVATLEYLFQQGGA
ncbi:MAG: hypothetical protein HQL94_08115 [Magnetococcales bacterium]|nr:hypothetical protein [Magnetococcales bacterium]